MKKDPAAWGKNVADDYTVFEGAYPTRIDGKAMMQRIFEGGAGNSSTLVTAEMANEKVQVYGDVAILSYNYIGASKSADGKISPTAAKSTRVYAKQGGQWMLVSRQLRARDGARQLDPQAFSANRGLRRWRGGRVLRRPARPRR